MDYYSIKELKSYLYSAKPGISNTPEKVKLALFELSDKIPVFEVGYHPKKDFWFALLEDTLLYASKEITVNKLDIPKSTLTRYQLLVGEPVSSAVETTPAPVIPEKTLSEERPHKTRKIQI